MKQNYPSFCEPEMQLLMACVARGIGVDGSAFSDIPVDAVDMGRVAELAEIHRVASLAWDGLKSIAAGKLSTVQTERMQQAAVVAWARSTLLAKELARVAALFTSTGIAFAAIKGPALGAEIYGDPAKRSMRDLDILVRTSDLENARSVLLDNGFECIDLAAAIDPIYQELYARYSVHWTYRHRKLGYLVELHIRLFEIPELFPSPNDELIAGSTTVDIDGVAVPTLPPRHHYLYQAVHGARHGWFRLHWLADFAGFALRRPELLVDPELWRMVDRFGLDRAVAAGFVLSHRYFDVPIPAAILPRTSDRCVDKIVSYAVRRLPYASVPASVGEKCAEIAHTLRLRRGIRFYRSVLTAHLVAGQPDLIRFPLPKRLFFLYPALRPLMWAIRTLEAPKRAC